MTFFYDSDDEDNKQNENDDYASTATNASQEVAKYRAMKKWTQIQSPLDL